NINCSVTLRPNSRNRSLSLRERGAVTPKSKLIQVALEAGLGPAALAGQERRFSHACTQETPPRETSEGRPRHDVPAPRGVPPGVCRGALPPGDPRGRRRGGKEPLGALGAGWEGLLDRGERHALWHVRQALPPPRSVRRDRRCGRLVCRPEW